MSEVPNIQLENERLMPIVGFGTWQATDQELEKAVNDALEAGYRHIDCAPVYENEHIIGKVLKEWIDSKRVTREELFITSKLPPCGNRPTGVEKYLTKTLKDLQLDYLDLYLIHCPFAFVEEDGNMHPKDENGRIKIEDKAKPYQVWEEMEQMVIQGHIKALGISNFNQKQIEVILRVLSVPLSNLQIEMHLYFQQKEMVDFCNKEGIKITAYSPLGSRGLVKLLNKEGSIPDLLENAVVKKIADKHKKTPGQIALKHIVSKGIAVIPKSTNPKRIKENIELFGWELDNEDIEELNGLDQGEDGRICDFTFLPGVEEHSEFPFKKANV